MRNRAFKPATSACGSYGINEPLCLPAASGRLRALPLAALMESTRRFVCLQRSGDFAPYRLRLLYVSDQRERGFLSARQREPGVRRRTALPLAALMESTHRFVCLQRPGDFAPSRLRLL